MSTLDKARATQLKNIESRTGKDLAELTQIIKDSGLKKHGQIRDHLIKMFGLGYGDATMLVHFALKSDGQSAAEASGATLEELTAAIYERKSDVQREIHEKVMTQINTLGEFETAPKKAYLSLRRKRQFTMLGPATKGRVELGLNMKGVQGTDRLLEQKAGGMCQYKVFLDDPSQVDDELFGWVRLAYEKSA